MVEQLKEAEEFRASQERTTKLRASASLTPAKIKIECYNFGLCFPFSSHRGRVAQLAEQLTLNQ
jgi:hypothetical protein